jgi:hypothetical protein
MRGLDATACPPYAPKHVEHAAGLKMKRRAKKAADIQLLRLRLRRKAAKVEQTELLRCPPPSLGAALINLDVVTRATLLARSRAEKR